MTVTEERDEYLTMLRKTCKAFVGPLPPDVKIWWDAELLRIAQQKAQQDAKREAMRQEFLAEIAKLQAKLVALA